MVPERKIFFPTLYLTSRARNCTTVCPICVDLKYEGKTGEPRENSESVRKFS